MITRSFLFAVVNFVGINEVNPKLPNESEKSESRSEFQKRSSILFAILKAELCRDLHS